MAPFTPDRGTASAGEALVAEAEHEVYVGHHDERARRRRRRADRSRIDRQVGALPERAPATPPGSRDRP